MVNLLLEIPAPPYIIVPVVTFTGLIFPICIILFFEAQRRREIRNEKETGHSAHH
ncbi:hypothetical protein [Anseongella ginsenosidimutans]|uniref:hypothetical protein n=1 Tax=Anseongella ginsenosidimutans TaxID=496056 RepID=UPI0013151327|nr:hypothetical protein [Anseongella ginsenosidimutans]